MRATNMMDMCNLTGRGAKFRASIPLAVMPLAGLAGLLAVLACALPRAAQAQSTFNPYVSAQAEHDSNVFRVQNSAVAEQYYGGPQLDDTDFRYIAGVEGTYLWSLQKLSATFEGRKIDYDHFTFLDHTEYLGNVRWDWKLADVLDGILQARQERVAASFADRDSPGLEVDIDRNIIGKLNLRFRTDWRLETGANFHTYKAPLQQFPDFVEHETGSHLGLSYLGVTNLTYGVGADHISGNYSHAPGVGPYNQTNVYLNATYVINGLQTVNGALGYTRRNQSEGSLDATTGDLRYVRQLTGKTSLTAEVQRSVNSYVASAGSEIDTNASVGAKWQATYKLAVNLSAAYLTVKYVGQVIPGSTANGRTDHSPNGMLTVTYQALRQLQVKGYANTLSRTSSYTFDEYHDTTYGVQVQAHWR